VAFDVLPLAGELTGVGRFCAGLAAALVGLEGLELRGYAVARRARTDTTAPAGVLGLDVRTWRAPARLANAVWGRAELPPIEWLVGPVEVVHGTNYVVPPARHAGRVVSVHDLTALRYPELCAPASLAYPGLVGRAARHGAFVHVPSSFVRDEVVDLLGVDAARVQVVPYGVDGPGQIAPARPPAPAGGSAPARSSRSLERPSPSVPYLLALGAVEPRKDLPTLVRAFAELAPSHEDLELVVAGPDGWGAPAFAAAVAASGVAGRVVRLGYLGEDERRSLLSGAVALAYPSLYEGFGFPPLEAMASGVPVVATTAGSLPEILGDAAELVPPGDAGALAGALARVLEDSGLRSRLVEAGRLRAASFTWASAAASMMDLYQRAALDRQSR
jgi:glycosyltransferase involved in cell wall biosynthesis